MEVIHPRDFYTRFGFKASPATLTRWRKRGFPAALSIPQGCFLVSEVESWLAQQAAAPRATRPSTPGPGGLNGGRKRGRPGKGGTRAQT